MDQSTTKVLVAQAEYWHAGHLAELLIEVTCCLATLHDQGLPDSGIAAVQLQNCIFRKRAMGIVKNYLNEADKSRPDWATDDPVLAVVREDFAELFESCVGHCTKQLRRQLESALLECVNVLQNWILRVDSQIEPFTGRPTFEWVDLAATLTEFELPIDGVDGRLARLRRIIRLLDAVIATDKLPSYDVIGEIEWDESTCGVPIGVGVELDRYSVICRFIESHLKTGQTWMTVSECANLLLNDVDGLDLERAKARVSWAASHNKFRTNGKKGNNRRIDRDSFNTWRLEQRERGLDSDNQGH